ncbi:MAG: hypothetical protein JNL05_00495 [Flavobacteriales bacterium]|nr:hypothetical protein [Flavobacteriales bacterium]
MALFKTTEDLRTVFPARLTLEIDDLLPTLERVEKDYLVEQVLGEQQYNELHVAYQAGTITNGDRLDDLLQKCRVPVAELAVMHYADGGSLQLNSTGLTVASENVASINRIERYKHERKLAGFSGLAGLLGFLQARVSDFPLWASSTFAAYGKGLLRTTAQFNHAVYIANDHWLWWRMRHIQDRHQDADSRIAATLCSPDLYNELVTQSNAGDAFSAANKKLMAFVRPAIAHLTIAEAVTELALQKDERGVWSWVQLSAADVAAGPAPASAKMLDAWQEYHTKRANEFIEGLGKKLLELAKAGDLPLYAASTCYAERTAADQPTKPDPTRRVGNFI